MNLFLLRHAEAEDITPDASRPLTVLGRKQSRVVGKTLRQCGVELDTVYSSPLVRARETAQAVVEAARSDAPVRVTRQLLNTTTPVAFFKWLDRLRVGAEGSVLLVGHEPSLSAHLAWVLGASSASPVRFPKAGLVELEYEPGAADSARGTARLRLALSVRRMERLLKA